MNGKNNIEEQWAGDQPDNAPIQRMPFDSSDLSQIPAVTESDPPYRHWWVEDDE